MSFFAFLGLRGGQLLELFIVQHGRDRDSKRMTASLKFQLVFLPEELTLLHKRYVMPFWLHLSHVVHQMNQKVVFPLALWVLLLEFRGLSRIGKTLLSFTGMSPSIRTVDRIKEDLLVQQSLDLQKIVNTEVFICALDNYTHVYGSPTITRSRDTQYHNPLYTVVAIIKIPQQFESILRPMGLGEFMCSLPASVLTLEGLRDQVRPPTFVFLLITIGFEVNTRGF